MAVELSKSAYGAEDNSNDIDIIIQKIQKDKESLDKDFASLKGLSSRIAIEKQTLDIDIAKLLSIVSKKDVNNFSDFSSLNYDTVSRVSKTANTFLENLGQILEDTTNKVADVLNNVNIN